MSGGSVERVDSLELFDTASQTAESVAQTAAESATQTAADTSTRMAALIAAGTNAYGTATPIVT